jgi:hypothetical protein
MIDLIEIDNKKITPERAVQIAIENNLIENSKGNVIYYDNHHRPFDGYFIKVEKNRLKINVSLHKFFNKAIKNRPGNFDTFTMSNVQSTFEMLEIRTHTDLKKSNVTYYEIGLNIELPQNCKLYLDKIQSIGILDENRPFYVNARYKDERIKTTLYHKDIRKYYKVYDKCFEMKDKRLQLPDNLNILRIETVFKRVEKMTVEQFLSPSNVKKMTGQFFREWRTIQFEKLIITPKGTRTKKIDLCKQILETSPETVLMRAEKDYKNNVLSDKGYRTIREFIQYEWDSFKHNIKIEQSPEEKEFRAEFSKAYKISKC